MLPGDNLSQIALMQPVYFLRRNISDRRCPVPAAAESDRCRDFTYFEGYSSKYKARSGDADVSFTTRW